MSPQDNHTTNSQQQQRRQINQQQQQQQQEGINQHKDHIMNNQNANNVRHFERDITNGGGGGGCPVVHSSSGSSYASSSSPFSGRQTTNTTTQSSNDTISPSKRSFSLWSSIFGWFSGSANSDIQWNNNKSSVEVDDSCSAGCPYDQHLDHDENSTYEEYNVYGERIDTRKQNVNASNLNQKPHPDQGKPLGTQRIQSTIPKGSSIHNGNSENDQQQQQQQEKTWLYPSEQMFYNALKRKGKANGITEDDMNMLIKIHNGTNERAWKKILEWERELHNCECEHPTLLKFMGKPHQLSPKAWMKSKILQQHSPFDRHDWIVDRCGQRIRYVLDFYYADDSDNGNQETPSLVKNEDGFYVPKDVNIDVRPALDSFGNVMDRAKFFFRPKKSDV